MKNNHLRSISHDLRNYISNFLAIANIISDNIADFQEKQATSGLELDNKLKEALDFSNMLSPHLT